MAIDRRKALAMAAVAGGAAVSSALSTAAWAAETSWDRIQRSGTVRIGVIPNRPPYFWQDGGEWVGFSATMGQDVAQALSVAMKKEIKPDFVITSWTTIVLDIQADKVDTFFGLSLSDERKKAINLLGPLYSIANVAIDAKGFNPGDRWAAYDNPGVKVAVVMGTTDEQAARKFLPNASIRAMKGMAEAVLDIQSGNSQTMVTTVLTGLGALKSNKSLGRMTVLQPAYTLPSFAGSRRDGDERFAQFLQGWADSYRSEGKSKAAIVQAMEKFGLDTSLLPADVTF